MKSPQSKATLYRDTVGLPVTRDLIRSTALQTSLRAMCEVQLDIQKYLGDLGRLNRWWVTLSHVRCDAGCGYLCACYVAGLPNGPMYLCPLCGGWTMWDELEDAIAAQAEREPARATAIGQPQG